MYGDWWSRGGVAVEWYTGNDEVGPDNKKLGVCFGYVVDKGIGVWVCG